MNPVLIQQGQGPVILGQPHGGTHVPDPILARLNDRGRLLSDTDWHINRLYHGLLAEVTVVEATFHRYVIDANRDPAGASLYPGQNTTGLCPVTDFDGLPIWAPGQEPNADEIEHRRLKYHAPYHAALTAQIERVNALHGVAIVLDCHSIRSRIPFLFDGILPVFNIGTNDGATCDPALAEAFLAACQPMAKTVLNGRFKGGWTTRHYGQPQNRIHAIQLEIAQRAYLDTESPPWTTANAKVAALRATLASCLSAIDLLARSGILSKG